MIPRQCSRSLPAAVLAIAVLAPAHASASSGTFSVAELLAVLAFALDSAIGPMSLLALGVVAILRLGWRRWIAVLAVFNLVLAGVLVVFDTGGLGSFIALAWLQGIVAIAVLVVGTRPAWRGAVFGEPSAPDITPGWRHVATVAEGDAVTIDGVDPWASQWHALDEPLVTVAHPSWPAQRHRLRVHELRTTTRTLRFAAGELSPNVWAFFLPADGTR